MSACSRPGCGRQSVATLTYDYESSRARVTDLVTSHPMHYDLCGPHADRLSVPKGWDLVDERLGSVIDIRSRMAG